jgi:hypothetical protein
MSLNFSAQERIVVDSNKGIKIYPPRVQPAPTPLDDEQIEFEYSIYEGDSSYSLNIFGHEKVIERDGRTLRVCVLNIGRDWMLKDALKLKFRWDIASDEFSFLCALARGLVGVLALRMNMVDDALYSVVIDADVLIKNNVAIPKNTIRNDFGYYTLAEVFVPARIDSRGVL